MISMGHAKALLGLTNGPRQVELMSESIRRDLSVRELELRVREEIEPAKSIQPALPRPAKAPWAVEMERRMRESLGTKVTLAAGPNYRGQIVVEFYNRHDLERIFGLIAPPARV